MTTIAGLPDKVTATLADDDPRATVYQIEDWRGYTGHKDTIRILLPSMVGRDRSQGLEYVIQRLGRDGWHDIASGRYSQYETAPIHAAVRRAIAILYGLEDHG